MKKILQFMKQNILGLILGLVIAGSIGVYAVSVASSDVTYDNANSGSEATTVEGAIDDLYTKLNSSSISNIVYIGATGNSTATYNIKNSYPDIYANLTTDNFFFGGTSGQSASVQGGSCPGNYGASRSYDPNTGILTVRGIRTNRQRSDSYCDFSLISLTVYMIY